MPEEVLVTTLNRRRINPLILLLDLPEPQG